MSLFAIANNYEQLIAAIRERRIELGLPQLAVDHLSGMAEGYCAKLEARLTNPEARNARTIGADSLPVLLRALGMHLAVFTEEVPGKVAGKKSASLGLARTPRTRKTLRIQPLPLNQIMAERGRAGGTARAQTQTAEHRQALARKAAAARWSGRLKPAEPSRPTSVRKRLTKRQAAALRKRLVAERAALRD